jgi:hypothetical protein
MEEIEKKGKKWKLANVIELFSREREGLKNNFLVFKIY